ncbi:leukocyte receptor cluster member 9 isoform X1 [Malaclemys terrapin pileata]|uniref:leukocyte receptor cluster member 9 isoform X1 n=2 Tax=Malaclemys terrapin pileata TaxID=2991368 RepID=UPI0023A81121|nr:leukocyte receptor cluster member 9 isoform X1 [Malaclemys terrapin pileata]
MAGWGAFPSRGAPSQPQGGDWQVRRLDSGDAMEGRGPSAGGDFSAPPADPAGGAPDPGSDGPGVTEPAPTLNHPCSFFLAGSCRFGARCRNPHPGAPPAAPQPPHEPPSKKSLERPSKKPPMKTAGDVVSRILWDRQLPPGEFTVGHLDRFSGVREDAFTAFCWEDLASVGPEVLAIPQHRIQYFKYRGRVVWDKASRLDDVFGSTGGGRTILEVMEEEAGRQEAVGMGDGGAGVPEEAVAPENEEEEDVAEPGAQSCPPAPPRPTHFVAARITSPELRDSVARLQEALSQADPTVAEFCTPLTTLHLTLCLLRLDGAAEMQAAVTALRELQAEHRRLLPPAPLLRFRGLGTFWGRVLYAAPVPGPELAGLAHALEQGFVCKGLTVVPLPAHDCFHLTVAKIPAGGEPRLNLPPEPPGEELGTQAVESLCLCQVGGGRRTDGFYSTLVELDLY